MTMAYATVVSAVILAGGVEPILAQRASCAATASSMTAAEWVAAPLSAPTGPRGHLRLVADVPLRARPTASTTRASIPWARPRCFLLPRRTFVRNVADVDRATRGRSVSVDRW